MEEFINEIVTLLKDEIGLTDDDKVKLKQLRAKVINARNDIQSRRRYPLGYSDAAILSDLRDYISNIHNLALYDYNLIGAEGQRAHSEVGTARQWEDREKCFRGIVSFVR